MKVGQDLESDARRAALIRDVLGSDGVLMMDANQVWGVDEAIAWTKALARVRAVVDGGADEPRRHPRPRAHSAGGRADPHRHRRARREPRRLQAALPGGCDRRLPDRRVPRRRGERGARDHPDGGEVRRAGLPARGRRRPVRVRPAPRRLRLHQRQRHAREPRRRVGRPPARALPRPGRARARPLPRPARARLQHRDAAVVARRVRVPERPGVVDSEALVD